MRAQLRIPEINFNLEVGSKLRITLTSLTSKLQPSFVIVPFPPSLGSSGVSGRGVNGDIGGRKDSTLGAGVAGYKTGTCRGTASVGDSGGCMETFGSSVGNILGVASS